jgi:predicted MPP superfamily phosphohydrolase
MFGQLGICTPWAIDKHHDDNKEWLEVIEQDLHIRNLPDQLIGLKIAHLSDLHCSKTVSNRYLRHCIQRVNQLNPDVVLLTGDYITHDFFGCFSESVVDLIGSIQSRYGVFACMGNHDYGVNGISKWLGRDRFYGLMEGMTDNGVTVLRNASSVVQVDGEVFSIVGLGDIWARDFDPAKAFEKVHNDRAVVVLSHNPESIRHLDGFDCDAVMSGHTHGVALQFCALGNKPLLNRHDYHAGMYEVRGKRLYVNRGLGRLGRALFNARPEITIFNLK